ncbi:MAG: LemA family protein [Crocinitomicaceae bacterium]|nr:LemA family protein [Crocinitomicaceae bacterium]
MKKTSIILLVIGALIVMMGFGGCNSYNKMATSDEGVTKQWQQVEVAYQARMDKTKNLFAIVEKAGNFEKSTLQEVMNARASATQVKIDVNDLTPENIAKFEKAQNAFGSSLGRLMAVSENYPNLKTVDAFRDFQAQYEGMENRIATERRRFNDQVGTYNTMLRRFPGNIWAGLFGFDKRGYFQGAEGSETAPDIQGM